MRPVEAGWAGLTLPARPPWNCLITGLLTRYPLCCVASRPVLPDNDPLLAIIISLQGTQGALTAFPQIFAADSLFGAGRWLLGCHRPASADRDGLRGA